MCSIACTCRYMYVYYWSNSNETQSAYFVFITQLGCSMNMYKLYNCCDYLILHNYYVMYKYMSVVAIHYETMHMYEKIQFNVHVIYLLCRSLISKGQHIPRCTIVHNSDKSSFNCKINNYNDVMQIINNTYMSYMSKHKGDWHIMICAAAQVKFISFQEICSSILRHVMSWTYMYKLFKHNHSAWCIQM